MTPASNPTRNEDTLFHFDDSEDPARWFDVQSSSTSDGPSQGGGDSQPAASAAGVDPPQVTPDRMLQTYLASAFRLQSSPITHDGRQEGQVSEEKRADGVLKPKSPLASQPMLIRRTTSPSQHDLFALSLEPAFSLSSRSNSQSRSDSDPNHALPMLSLSPSSFASVTSSADVLVQTPADQVGAYTHPPPRIASQSSDETFLGDFKGKGKERALRDDDPPPVLPPLGFSPPMTIFSPSSDLRPDLGVPGSSKIVASPPYISRDRAYAIDVDDQLETGDGMEVDILECRRWLPHSPSNLRSPLSGRHLESPQTLQRFIPPASRQPYVPPHHIPSRRHSFSIESPPHRLHHSSSDAALTLGVPPAQGAIKEKSKGRFRSALRSRAPSNLGLGGEIARKLFFRRRLGEGYNSEPASAGNSRPMTPPPSLATSFVHGNRLSVTNNNNVRDSRILDLDLPDASAVRMTSCFLPKCGLTIPSGPPPTLKLNSDPNPNPIPTTNPPDTVAGPRGGVISTPDSPPASPIPGIPIEFPHNLAALYADPVPIPIATARPSEAALLKAKGRSYSSPFPLPAFGPISALDIISTPQPDVFEPLRFDLGGGVYDEDSGVEEEKKSSLFDELLPREIKLATFAWVVRVHEMDHERLLNASLDDVFAKTKSGSIKWTAHKAGMGRNRWVGRDRGIRELVKLGRVSKAWRDLVFDGQLWRQLDLSSFPRLPTPVLTALAKTAGAFITSLDLTGHTRLAPETLGSITDHLCLSSAPSHILPHTQLIQINLHGCTGVTTRPLHRLLRSSPLLERLNVKGLKAVTNVTLDVLSTSAPLITHLNLSRCLNVDAQGLKSYFAAAMDREETLRLKDLRVSGLQKVDDDVMEKMGRTCPELEVLDLSYAKDLHNSAVDAFVRWPKDWGVPSPLASPLSSSPSSPGYPFPSPSSWPSLASFPSSFLSAFEERERREQAAGPALKWNHHQESVLLTSREAGRDAGDPTRYRRRITQLRHINLSFCTLLTDIAPSHLAHAVPRLEFFEMAGIGGDVREEGLIRLFKTTPWIRKIDLEDAADVGDSLIEVLTPDPSSSDIASSGLPALVDGPAPQPGHALEDLIISHAIGVNNDTLITMVRRCTRLRVLEADGTRVSPATVKEFVKLSRERGIRDARLVAIDCRSVGDAATKDVFSLIRPRMGWRAYGARRLGYLDSRDDEYVDIAAEVGGGDSGRKNPEGVVMDECDPERVVVKTFYTWQVVDQVKAAREKRAKANKVVKARNRRNRASDDLDANGLNGGFAGGLGGGGARMRWWPGAGSGRSSRFAGAGTPTALGAGPDREGCVLM